MREAGPARIAFCHLESLVCLPAINMLFQNLGDQIGLVLLSNRFGGRNGGLSRQFLRGVRRSGLRLTLWLGFDIIAVQVIPRLPAILRSHNPQLLAVRELAARHGAQVLETYDVNDEASLNAIRAYRPDFLIVVNFDQILRQAVVDAVATVMNVHPSSLPRFRGPCPVFWAMAEGGDALGVTVHIIDSGKIDAGPVLRQQVVERRSSWSVAEATSILFAEGVNAITSLVKEGLTVSPRHQDDTVATYESFPNQSEMKHARAKGVRLVRLRDLKRLITAAIAPTIPSP